MDTRTRRIGPVGTLVRGVIGSLMVATAVASGAGIAEWLLGAIFMPAAVIIWQKSLATINPQPIRMVGPLAHAVTAVAFLVLFLTPYYAPALSVTSGAALIFFGGSMLIGAIRGYKGCEILALSNWLLGRDDQIGCALYSPIDRLEADLRSGHTS